MFSFDPDTDMQIRVCKMKEEQNKESCIWLRKSGHINILKISQILRIQKVINKVHNHKTS